MAAKETQSERTVIRFSLPAYETMADYIVPMLKYVESLPPLTRENEDEGPYAVVIAPMRDRAQEIYKDTWRVALSMGGAIKVVSICLGTLSFEQHGFPAIIGCKVLISTPNRLYDCLRSGYFVLNQCRFLVIDFLLDIGSGEVVTKILDALPSPPEEEEEEEIKNNNKKNYRLFVGNMTPAVERLARKYPGWYPFVAPAGPEESCVA